MRTSRSVVTLVFVVVFLSACANLDLARAGHDALKHASCEQSEPRGSCNRDWGDDYRAWQAQRSAYLETLEAERTVAAAVGDWLRPVDSSDLPEL